MRKVNHKKHSVVASSRHFGSKKRQNSGPRLCSIRNSIGGTVSKHLESLRI